MKKALIFWFTGLSGAGKTTVAIAVKPLLEAEGRTVMILDGDDVRKQSHAHLGFTEHDIIQNNILIARMCRTYQHSCDVILVPIISPYTSSRRSARKLLGEGFYVVYFAANLDTVGARDVKGLYAKAEHGEINNLIGFSPGCVYQPPAYADCVIDSAMESVEDSAARLFGFVVGCVNRCTNVELRSQGDG